MLLQSIVGFIAPLTVLALVGALAWTSNTSLRYVDHRYFWLPWYLRYVVQGVGVWYLQRFLPETMENPGLASWIVTAAVIGIVAETVYRYYRRHYQPRQKLVARNPFQGYPQTLPPTMRSDQRSELVYDPLHHS